MQTFASPLSRYFFNIIQIHNTLEIWSEKGRTKMWDGKAKNQWKKKKQRKFETTIHECMRIYMPLTNTLTPLPPTRCFIPPSFLIANAFFILSSHLNAAAEKLVNRYYFVQTFPSSSIFAFFSTCILISWPPQFRPKFVVVVITYTSLHLLFVYLNIWRCLMWCCRLFVCLFCIFLFTWNWK